MFLSIAAALLMPAETGSLVPGNHLRFLDVGGRPRAYFVHVPAKYDPKSPGAVVLVFQGGVNNAREMPRFCGLDETADQHNFIVVYPFGTGQRGRAMAWNAGDCCGEAVRHNVDDVGFARSLLDDLAKVVQFDPKRVYAAGMGNGAMMVYRLASELSDRIAAIAPIAGSMGTESCAPSRPVSVIHFHGTADRLVPYKGGKGEMSPIGTIFHSVEHSIQSWVKANGCRAEPEVSKLPDKAGDGTTVRTAAHRGGKEGSEVVLVTIDGMGHAWPGREPLGRAHGQSSSNVSANEMMWQFFAKHPMKPGAR
jgi:polyhydroxybutyrate depolymerase